MTKASTLTLILALLVTSSGAAFGQAVAEQEAVDHAVRLQADQIALRHKLEAARAARERHDFATAATLYGDAWKLVQEIGPNVEQEAAETQAGVAATRLPLAEAAQNRGDLREANRQVSEILRIDPTNADAISFKAGNDKRLHDLAGKTPSEDAVAQIPTIVSNRVAASTLVQDGKLFYEMGQLDAAEAKLRQAVKENPADQSAYYYLNLIREARFNEALNKRDIESRKSMVEVENDWATPPKRDVLPQPNPYARVNLIHTSPGRQEIMDKLDRIRLDEVNWDGTPLTAVIDDLSAKAKSRDPKKRGLNFIISATVDSAAAAAAAPVL